MPRKARIDAPGALHHIIDNFVKRLGDIVTETHTACFAWALIPNHASYCEQVKHLWPRL